MLTRFVRTQLAIFTVASIVGIAAMAMVYVQLRTLLGIGRVTVTLELHHTDTQLCVPLLVAHNLDDIAADWRAWSELYGLPMLMVEADGVARPLDDGSAHQAATTPTRRRRHSQIADRRPHFLVRRSTGKLGIRMKIEGREIIARR